MTLRINPPAPAPTLREPERDSTANHPVEDGDPCGVTRGDRGASPPTG